MSWLVDTDVLSERARRQPDLRLLRWLEENASQIYTSSHVIGELQAGISLLPDSFIAATARRHNLTTVTRNTADYRRPGLRVFNPVAEPGHPPAAALSLE